MSKNNFVWTNKDLTYCNHLFKQVVSRTEVLYLFMHKERLPALQEEVEIVKSLFFELIKPENSGFEIHILNYMEVRLLESEKIGELSKEIELTLDRNIGPLAPCIEK
jgi:hypothetical protein